MANRKKAAKATGKKAPAKRPAAKKSSARVAPSKVSEQEILKQLLDLKQQIKGLVSRSVPNQVSDQSLNAGSAADEKFRTIFENSTIAITVGDPKEKLVSWNKSVERLLGMSSRDLKDRSIQSLYPKAEWKKIRSFNLREHGSSNSMQTQMLTKDGELIDVDLSISFLKDKKGKITGSIGFIRDISRQKEAEHAIRASEQKFRAVFENAAVAIIVADTKDCTVSWNKFTERILGMDSEALELRPMHSFFPLDEWKKIQALDVKGRESTEPIETRMIAKSGDVLHVDLSIGLLKEDTGKVTGSVMIARDITERKRIEAARKAKEDAETLTKTKSEFLATMSHEIRTPMNGVIGMIELLLDMDLTLEQREYVSTAKTSADSLMTLINDILDFSKIESGKLELENVPFGLRDNLGDTVQTLALRAHTKGLELICHIPPHVPDNVVGDPGRLRQVIINLVGNAIKFTQEGEIVIEVELENTNDDGVELRFSIIDTGIGISKDKQHLIFESFSQADSSTTRKYGGTGLGLAICVELVQLMTGRIWVESPVKGGIGGHEGQGSAFRFTAKLGLEDTHEDKMMPVSVLNFKQLPVLVVDDNTTNRYMLEEMLNHWDMKVWTAGSGREAMGVMETLKKEGQKLSFIVIDANMPMIDGFQLAAHIKRQTAFDDAKLVMMTASGMRGDAARCRELGVSAYLTKPINESKLMDTLLMVMATPGAGTEKAELITRHTLREKRRILDILLVEDNPVNQLVATRMLEKQGHKVKVAGNGLKALEEHQKGDHDLILMDIQLPEMDGYEATGKIREREKETGVHIPIIAMTANAMKEDRQRCLDAGMDGYVPKPVKPKELFDAIAQFFGGREAVDEKALEDNGAAREKKPAEKQNAQEPAAQPEDSGPALLSAEDGMAHAGGDRDLWKAMVDVFMEDTPERLEKIKTGLETQDVKTVECESHGIKGAAANVGADRIREIALKIEMASKDEKLAGLEGELEHLGKAFEDLKNYLAAHDISKA